MSDTITKQDGSFMNEEEIATHVVVAMLPSHKPSWLRTPRSALIAGHHSIGMGIRNQYGLWDPLNPHTSDDGCHRNHPDQISMRVIEKVWEKLRQEYTALGPRAIEGPVELPPDNGTRLYHDIGRL